MVFVKVPDMRLSRRLFRVVLPPSRVLKWSWPAVRLRTFPFLVILNLLATALCVFISFQCVRAYFRNGF